jgi:hypothetical protein
VKHLRLLLAALLAAALLLAACKGGEEEYAEPEAFSFVIYPGSRYLGQLTDKTKEAHKVMNPAVDPPPTAIYDTDASVEQVAEYYAQQYGYAQIAPEKGTSATVPQAYYRTGDLAVDAKAIEPLLPKIGLQTDVSKASGAYKGAEIAPRPNRPRVTITRPYFDVTTSQVVDRTLILMSR